MQIQLVSFCLRSYIKMQAFPEEHINCFFGPSSLMMFILSHICIRILLNYYLMIPYSMTDLIDCIKWKNITWKRTFQKYLNSTLSAWFSEWTQSVIVFVFKRTILRSLQSVATLLLAIPPNSVSAFYLVNYEPRYGAVITHENQASFNNCPLHTNAMFLFNINCFITIQCK